MKSIILFVFILILSAPVIAQTWSSGSNIPERVRAGNTAAYSKNGNASLFVVSGRNQNELIIKKLQRYDLSTNTWTDLASHPTGLLGGATTVLNDSLYVIGGVVNPPGSGSNKVYKYSINQNTWSQAANFPFGIVDAKAVSYQDSLIYVAGGLGGANNGKVYLYNCNTNKWRVATPFIPSGSRNFGGFAIKGDTLVYMCGTDGFLSSNYFNTVHVGVINQNNRALITWTIGAPFPGATRTFFDANTWSDGIIMTGGSTDNTFETYSSECYVYHPGSNTWTQKPNKPTAWLTGQSGSLKLPNGEWKLICASGYQSAYLNQTEIFTESGTVSAPDFLENGLCDPTWMQFQNPVNQFTTIRYCMPQSGLVTLSLSDGAGRVVKILVQEILPAGEQSTVLDTTGLSNGLYYISLRRNDSLVTRKLCVMN